MSKFKRYMKISTTEEKEKLAKEAGTSAGHLYQLASGERSASADLAGALEIAFKKLYPKSNMTRADFSKACAKCPYFKQCKLKEKTK